MENLSGYVEHIVFRNEDNGYTVFQLVSDEGELTCVGTFPYINEGEMLDVSGEYTTHAVYGTQLKVLSHKIKEPEDLLSIERYSWIRSDQGTGSCISIQNRTEV